MGQPLHLRLRKHKGKREKVVKSQRIRNSAARLYLLAMTGKVLLEISEIRLLKD